MSGDNVDKGNNVKAGTDSEEAPSPISTGIIIGVTGVLAVIFLAATIGLGVELNKSLTDHERVEKHGWKGNQVPHVSRKGDNPCFQKQPFRPSPRQNAGNSYFANVACIVDGVVEALELAGGDVTLGYKGNLDVGEREPISRPYFESGLCPVNVHWHLGAEHLSDGEYDPQGWGPEDGPAGAAIRPGSRCHKFDETDPKFTTPFEWKHCLNMEVGETYEVHWPHSAAGDCGTVNQYQTPFYDGVFCNLPMDAFTNLVETQGAQGIASAVGVHGQIFTIVNDESYFYGDMIRGMIIDGDMGKDIHMYTGSTTGTSRDNEMCSSYAPITWQVDRKCHMISASSFDKMCYDMKMQRDDMSGDLHAHGARELVHHDYVGNNQHYPDAVEAAPVDEPAAGETTPAEEPAAEAAPTDESAAADPFKKRDLAESTTTMMYNQPEASFLEDKMKSDFYTDLDANVCAGKKLALDNKLCVNLNAPQAGANVTKGYVGQMDVGDLTPNTKPYFQSSMCPVNVHWHLGTEHYSAGEYDESGDGPHGNIARPEWANRARDLAEGKILEGFRCHHYDVED